MFAAIEPNSTRDAANNMPHLNPLFPEPAMAGCQENPTRTKRNVRNTYTFWRISERALRAFWFEIKQAAN
jgi:hypothetical protein